MSYSNTIKDKKEEDKLLIAKVKDKFQFCNSKNKITAGILAVLFGAWGAHKFYLGYFKTGIIMALTTIILLPAGIVFLTALIGACEGVHYLMMDRERFYLQYVAHKKYWF